MDDEQSEPDVPRQQRRAESADPVDFAVGEQRARRLGRSVRAGAVDARSSDAAGRAAIRSRAELVSRRSRKGRRDSCRRRSSFPRHAASTATRTSRRRMGVAYDLFGTGRTALKMSLGKYLEGAGVSGNYANTQSRRLRMPQTTPVFGTAGVTRAWTDANRNFVPDCDLLNPAAQDLAASGGDLCGVHVEHELRQERPDQQLRSEHPRRLGRPSVGLESRRLDSAADRTAVVGGRDLQPPLVSRLLRRRQPGAAAVRSDAVQHRGAARSPAAGRRRLRRVRTSTTSSPRRPDRSTTSSPIRAGTERGPSTSTASTSPSTPASDRSLTLVGGTSTGQTVADNCDVRARLPELATTTTGTSAFGAGLTAPP